MAADTTVPCADTMVCYETINFQVPEMDFLISRLPGNGSSARAPEAGSAAPAIPSLLSRIQLRLSGDEELVATLRAGNPDALTILFERYHALLFRKARHVLRDTVEAEDAVQQVFFDLYRSVEKFDRGKASFKTWLLMFAYCRIIDRWRQLQASHFYDSETCTDILSEVLETARQRPFHPAEATRLVEQVLQLITPRQRRTIELVYYEGLTATEVATRTGETVRVVRHNLYRGLEKMRSVLQCAQPARQVVKGTAIAAGEHERP